MEHCIICKSTNIEPLFTRSAWLSPNNEFTLYRCKKCGLIFLDPIPSWDTLSRYYSLCDAIEQASRTTAVAPSRPPFAVDYFLRLVGRMARRGEIGGQGLRVLDVGCGDGTFLKQMQLRGAEAYGVEPDILKAEMCLDKTLNVFCGTLLESKFQQNSFHLITLNHVFEHLPNPHETPTNAESYLLKPER